MTQHEHQTATSLAHMHNCAHMYHMGMKQHVCTAHRRHFERKMSQFSRQNRLFAKTQKLNASEHGSVSVCTLVNAGVLSCCPNVSFHRKLLIPLMPPYPHMSMLRLAIVCCGGASVVAHAQMSRWKMQQSHTTLIPPLSDTQHPNHSTPTAQVPPNSGGTFARSATGACPVRYFCINHPNVNPGFTLP